MVKVDGLRKKFVGQHGAVKAVDGISFEVPEGGLFTLLGPSGCGKSTTLRCVAGLEKPEDGEISVFGQPVFSKKRGIVVPPHKRGMGMVFQSYAIWPHMTVFENVAYPLRVAKKHSGKEIKEKVEKVLELVKLKGLESRPAPYLSGGQQQRLALARALVGEPKVLLLDEPLSNLDAKLREHMRLELRDLQRRIGVTTIYVTHDQMEALALSNVIAVMQDGAIVQTGAPRDMYERPNCKFVADFFGSTNFLEGKVSTRTGDSATVETQHGVIHCSMPNGSIGENVLVSVRPENIDVSRTADRSDNVFPAKVEQAAFLGEFLDCRLNIGDNELRARVHPSLALRHGETVYLRFPPESCMIVSQ
ncbi:MAG: ABC transporter ATP-binding protein [Dehalococcoidia bacterium]|nr:ABC transporter ATP-binding protein [Dehalococcoidia bacterium]